jgi:hypothetical protein
MHLNTLLLLILSILWASCKGQNPLPAVNPVENVNLIDIPKIDTVTAIGNNIMLVYQDNKNNYWFGSWEDGLYKYDGETIIHYSTANGFPHDRINEIKEDSSGNVYFNTVACIIKFDGKNFYRLKISDLDFPWKLDPKDLWFTDGWNSGSVFRCDGEFLYKLQLPKNQPGEEYVLENPTHPNPYTVYSIYKDIKGNVWFGTAALGALCYNGKSFDWILEKDVVEIYNEPLEGSNGVRSIIEDKEGYFWFNSGYRYQIYDRKENLTNNPDSRFYKRENSIGSLDDKRDGNIHEYLSIAKDNNDELWIATYDAGVYHYDGKKIKHYDVKDDSGVIKLFTVYKDKKGQIWLGTQESGAWMFNGRTFERFVP